MGRKFIPFKSGNFLNSGQYNFIVFFYLIIEIRFVIFFFCDDLIYYLIARHSRHAVQKISKLKNLKSTGFHCLQDYPLPLIPKPLTCIRTLSPLGYTPLCEFSKRPSRDYPLEIPLLKSSSY